MSFLKEIVDEVKGEIAKASQQAVPHVTQPPNRPGSNSSNQSGFSSQTREARTEQPQRPKQRKRPQQQQPQQGTTQQQRQTQKASPIQARQLVANLNPVMARSAIIMAEVLAPPVSKRQNRKSIMKI